MRRLTGSGRSCSLVQASLLDGLTGGWDLVCANLPYVATERLPDLAVARREPKLALDGGRRGTELTAHVVRSLNLGLAPGGLALLEIDEDQAEELMAVAQESMQRRRRRDHGRPDRPAPAAANPTEPR